MRAIYRFIECAALVLLVAALAGAAPNVTTTSQKGSLLIFPDIRVDQGWRTLVRIENDGNSDVGIKCGWVDGNSHRDTFFSSLTGNQAIWFDAASGQGSVPIYRIPSTTSVGFDNPFLPGGSGIYSRGLLSCWAVDELAKQQVMWNHLSGTATVWHSAGTAYEYSAYAFFVATGLPLSPVGTAGTLSLNGLVYDQCPAYQMGFVPPGSAAITVVGTRTLVSDFGSAAQGVGGLEPLGVSVESSGALLVVDRDAGTALRGALFRIDPQTGIRTLVSDFGDIAKGTLGVDPLGVGVETSGAILVVDANAGGGGRGILFRIDAGSGARTVLSDFGLAPQGTLGLDPSGIAIEPAGTILVPDPSVGTGSRGVLFRINATTGVRSAPANFGTAGQGPLGVEPVAVAVEQTGTILVLDQLAGTGAAGALFRLPSAATTRVLLSDFGDPTQGVLGVSPVGVAGEDSGTILVIDRAGGTGGQGALIRVDQTTGFRTVISDFGDAGQGAVGLSPSGVFSGGLGGTWVIDPNGGTGGQGALFRITTGGPPRLTLAMCPFDHRQSYTRAFTTYQFDVWNADEVKFTGAYECAGAWHETTFRNDVDAAMQNFLDASLGAGGGRFRVQGLRTTRCSQTTQAVGVIAVQSMPLGQAATGTTLTSAGRFSSTLRWDPCTTTEPIGPGPHRCPPSALPPDDSEPAPEFRPEP